MKITKLCTVLLKSSLLLAFVRGQITLSITAYYLARRDTGYLHGTSNENNFQIVTSNNQISLLLDMRVSNMNTFGESGK